MSKAVVQSFYVLVSVLFHGSCCLSAKQCRQLVVCRLLAAIPEKVHLHFTDKKTTLRVTRPRHAKVKSEAPVLLIWKHTLSLPTQETAERERLCHSREPLCSAWRSLWRASLLTHNTCSVYLQASGIQICMPHHVTHFPQAFESPGYSCALWPSHECVYHSPTLRSCWRLQPRFGSEGGDSVPEAQGCSPLKFI